MVAESAHLTLKVSPLDYCTIRKVLVNKNILWVNINNLHLCESIGIHVYYASGYVIKKRWIEEERKCSWKNNVNPQFAAQARQIVRLPAMAYFTSAFVDPACAKCFETKCKLTWKFHSHSACDAFSPARFTVTVLPRSPSSPELCFILSEFIESKSVCFFSLPPKEKKRKKGRQTETERENSRLYSQPIGHI